MKTAKRSAFTLIELLVVMAILAILASLVAAGIMSWISGQSRRNSETHIKEIFNAFSRQWDTVLTDAKKENIPLNASGAPVTDRTTWIRARLTESFPVSVAEINDASYATAPVNVIPAAKRRYRAGYKKLYDARTGTTQAKTESAALLVMALSVDRSGSSYTLDAFRAFMKDTDGDGLPEFVDGWNEPLYFYRFVQDNADLNSSQPQGITKTDDRFSALVSSGPNLKLGIVLPTAGTPLLQSMAVQNSLDADDNLYSFKIK